jgi:hypothetical protein
MLMSTRRLPCRRMWLETHSPVRPLRLNGQRGATLRRVRTAVLVQVHGVPTPRLSGAQMGTTSRARAVIRLGGAILRALAGVDQLKRSLFAGIRIWTHSLMSVLVRQNPAFS